MLPYNPYLETLDATLAELNSGQNVDSAIILNLCIGVYRPHVQIT